MRIAYVCADRGVPVFGTKGCSIHVQEVVRGMVRQGAEVILYAARRGGAPPEGLERVEVRRLERASSKDQRIREQSAMRANTGLTDRLRRDGPFDLVYERHSLFSYAGMKFAEATGIPGLLEVNAPLIEEQARFRLLVHDACARESVARAFGAASTLLAVSRGVAEYLEEQPTARGRVMIVPNGVDPARFDALRGHRPASGPRPFTIGFVGTLKPWHGLDVLLSAFGRLRAALPDVHLLLVGDGPERERIQGELADRGHAGSARLTGAVPAPEIPALLAEMDVAVAPYPPLDRFYFSPLKVYEYMAAGRAIVASAIGQVEETLVDGETGLLVPPGDDGALTEALIRLGRDPALRRRLGGAARVAAVRDHTWDAVVRRILSAAAADARVATRAQRAS